MRQGRGRRTLRFAKQKRLFLSRVSKLGQGPIRSSPKYNLSPCLVLIMVHGGLLHALIIGEVGGVCNWLCGNVQAVMVGQMAD